MPASEAVPQKQVFILRGGVIVVESLLDKSHFIHCIISPPKKLPKQTYPLSAMWYFTPDAVKTIFKSCPNHEFVCSELIAVIADVNASFCMIPSAKSDTCETLNDFQ